MVGGSTISCILFSHRTATICTLPFGGQQRQRPHAGGPSPVCSPSSESWRTGKHQKSRWCTRATSEIPRSQEPAAGSKESVLQSSPSVIGAPPVRGRWRGAVWICYRTATAWNPRAGGLRRRRSRASCEISMILLHLGGCVDAAVLCGSGCECLGGVCGCRRRWCYGSPICRR